MSVSCPGICPRASPPSHWAPVLRLLLAVAVSVFLCDDLDSLKGSGRGHRPSTVKPGLHVFGRKGRMKCSPHIIATGRPVHATGHSDADLHPLAEAASARPPRLLSPPARAPGRTSPCSPRFGLRLRSPRKGDRAVTGNGVLRFEFPHVPEHGCVSVCVCMSCACCVVHMLYVWCVCHMYVICALCVYVCKCVVCIHILCVLCVCCVYVCVNVLCVYVCCVCCVYVRCVCACCIVCCVCAHTCAHGV